MDRMAQDYVETAPEQARPALAALHEAVLAAHPGFDVAVKYNLLMYAIDGDWRHWVCAINATERGVCLRFLAGVLLSDPRGVLRAGTANLKTWDLPLDPPDAAAIGEYVREAVAIFPEFRANARQVNAEAKAAAKPARPPKPKA